MSGPGNYLPPVHAAAAASTAEAVARCLNERNARRKDPMPLTFGSLRRSLQEQIEEVREEVAKAPPPLSMAEMARRAVAGMRR